MCSPSPLKGQQQDDVVAQLTNHMLRCCDGNVTEEPCLDSNSGERLDTLTDEP